MAWQKFFNPCNYQNLMDFLHCSFIIFLKWLHSLLIYHTCWNFYAILGYAFPYSEKEEPQFFNCGPFALRWDSIWESREGFYFQIPFICAAWTDWLNISLDVLYQLLACKLRFPEKLLAKVNRHRHVYFVFVLVSRFLRYLNFTANPLAEVEHR